MRLLENILRFGTIAEVKGDFCRVQAGEIITDYLRWLAPMAGTTSEWSAPVIGEQVMVLSPGGDMQNGVVLRGIYSNAFPAPSNSSSTHLTSYPDGATTEYDHESHTLRASLPDGGKAEITATGGITLTGSLTVNGETTINGMTTVNGNVDISGTATASDDVVGGGVSLIGHSHGNVQPGSGNSGPPA